MPRHVKEIAVEIKKDWKNIDPYALAYANAMARPLSNKGTEFLIIDFLANAGTWRGEVARRIKAELRSMV